MNELENIRRLLLRRSDVRLAYVFGSTAAGTARASSDVDVAVGFAEEPDRATLDRLAADLQEAARRPVDMVVLGTAPPRLAHEIVSQGRLLMCRDEDERVRFEARVAARYLDTAHLRKTQYAYLRERAESRHAASR